MPFPTLPTYAEFLNECEKELNALNLPSETYLININALKTIYSETIALFKDIEHYSLSNDVKPFSSKLFYFFKFIWTDKMYINTWCNVLEKLGFETTVEFEQIPPCSSAEFLDTITWLRLGVVLRNKSEGINFEIPRDFEFPKNFDTNSDLPQK